MSEEPLIDPSGPVEVPSPEKKYYTVRQAAFIGVGAMVGAGIFALLGAAGEVAGAAVWLSFLLAGIVAGLQGYSFAKLGAQYPSAGGATGVCGQGDRQVIATSSRRRAPRTMQARPFGRAFVFLLSYPSPCRGGNVRHFALIAHQPSAGTPVLNRPAQRRWRGVTRL